MVRRIIRIFAWSLAVVAVLVGSLLVYLRSADLSVYQEQIESFVARQIGHELRVNGRFELQFGKTTVLVAEDAVLINPDWPDDGELLRVGHLTFAFNTWSVLSRPFLVEELRARDVSGALLRDASGRANWVSQRVQSSGSGGGSPDLTMIAFRRVDIERAAFRYDDRARSHPVQAVVEFLTVSPDDSGILDLDLRGDINGLALWADGKVGPWRNFVHGRDISADLDVALGQATFSLEGTVRDIVRLEGIELTAALSGPAIDRALERLALPVFASGEFTLTGDVRQQAVGHRVQLDGHLGQIVLLASGTTDSILMPRSVNYDFSIAGPSASAVAELAGIGGIPAEPFQVSGEYSRANSVIAFDNALLRMGRNSLRFDGDIDIDSLDADLALSAEGPDFSIFGAVAELEGLPAGPFAINGRVRRDGKVWQAENVDARVGENRLTMNGQIETGSSTAAEIALEATGPDISIVQDFTGLAGIPVSPFDIDVTLRSHPRGIEVVQGTGVFGGNRIDAQGIVALRPGLEGTAGSIRASGPDFHNVALLSGVPYLPPGRFDIAGVVTVKRNALLLDGVTAEVGDIRGTATGTVDIRGEYPGRLALDVTLAGADLAALAEVRGLEAFAGDPFRVGGRISREGSLLTATDLQVSLGNLAASLNGAVVGAAEQVRLSVSANASDSVIVRKLARLAYLPDGAVVIDGNIEKSDTDIRFTDAVANIGDYRVAANGSLSLQPRSNDSDLSFSISGPSLNEAGRIFGIPALPAKDFAVSGEFDGTPTGFAMREFIARVGDNDLRGEFDANLKAKPRLVGRLASTHLDLTDQMRAAEENTEEAESPLEPTAEGERNGRVFSDKPLATSWLQAADIDIELEIDEFTANTLRVSDVAVGFHLQDGALQVEPIFLRDDDGSIEADFSLAPEGDRYALKTRVQVRDVHVGLLAPGLEDTRSLPPTSGTLEFAGRGTSIRSIMASSNGRLSVRQGAGKVQEVFGSAIFKDVLLQVLRTLNPLRQERGFQLLECSIFNISITNGLATIDDFVIQTDTMTTLARGEINLRNERLDIAFRAKPREGIGISLGTVANELLEVRGTLKSPAIRLDAGRAATATGAAVATGGLSLLARGLWDRLSAEGDVCKQEPKKK